MKKYILLLFWPFVFYAASELLLDKYIPCIGDQCIKSISTVPVASANQGAKTTEPYYGEHMSSAKKPEPLGNKIVGIAFATIIVVIIGAIAFSKREEN